MNRKRLAFLTSVIFGIVIVTTTVSTVVVSAMSGAAPAESGTAVVEGNPGHEGGEPGFAGTAPEPDDTNPVSTCAALFQDMVGKPSKSLDKARLNTRSWRILHPGQMVTQEYQEGRVNIHVDDHGIVTMVTCG